MKSTSGSPSSSSGCRSASPSSAIAGEQRRDRVDAPTPRGLRDSPAIAGIVENSTSEPTSLVLVGEEVAPGADRAAARLDRDGPAPRTSRSARPGGARTRSRSRRRSCRRRHAAPRTGPRSRSALACDDSAVGGDDVGRHEVVDRQPVPAAQPADAAAQREPADAGVRDQAARRREAERLGRPVDVAPRRAALDARPGASGSTRTSLIVERSTITAAVGDRMAGDVVAAAADRDGQAVRAREA